ncbi:conserved hypothetical protein [Ricinus communis]|uniref:Uncharacterized protein n=1 Tax=Ricinus communis TaxID=3988 RepID=B9T9E9_RICCO|nr:conserved hypothetical protein [Ricinus communis]
MRVGIRLQHRARRRKHYGHVVGATAGHHRVDRDMLGSGDQIARRDFADDFIRSHAGGVEELRHRVRRRRHYRQAVVRKRRHSSRGLRCQARIDDLDCTQAGNRLAHQEFRDDFPQHLRLDDTFHAGRFADDETQRGRAGCLIEVVETDVAAIAFQELPEFGKRVL